MQEADITQFTGDRDLKAYIYQQLIEIQPFLASDSQLAVMVQQVEPEEPRQHQIEAVNTPTAELPVTQVVAKASRKGRAKKGGAKRASIKTKAATGSGSKRQLAAALTAAAEVTANSPETDSDFLVTLVATFEEGHLETEGQAADIYDAFGIAKDKMVSQLSEWQSAMINPHERAMQIQTIISGNYMVH